MYRKQIWGWASNFLKNLLSIHLLSMYFQNIKEKIKIPSYILKMTFLFYFLISIFLEHISECQKIFFFQIFFFKCFDIQLQLRKTLKKLWYKTSPQKIIFEVLQNYRKIYFKFSGKNIQPAIFNVTFPETTKKLHP